MKKAWGILKGTRITNRAKKITDEIMADGQERSVRMILDLIWDDVKRRKVSGRDTIPTIGELSYYLSKNKEYTKRIKQFNRRQVTVYERVI
tara:strand:+ start:4600 stop:4872 length:273 start_codon:yes stop_codon:yes gene_type:complete